MATVKYYLNMPKKNGILKTSEVSVNLKFSLDRKNRFTLASGEKINPKYWNTRTQQVKSNYTGHVEIIKNTIIQLWRENKDADLQTLKEKSRCILKYGHETAPQEKKTLLFVLNLFIEQYKKEKDEKTVQKYSALKNKVEAYQETHKTGDRQKHGFILPEISEQKLNENIKKVCRLAGIDQILTIYRWQRNKCVEITKPKCDHLSTHTGRRTFITIGLQFLKPKLVKDLAGVSWDTLKYYEGQSEDTVLIDGLNSIPTNVSNEGT